MDYWDELFEEQLDDDLKKLNNFSYVDGFDLIYDERKTQRTFNNAKNSVKHFVNRLKFW